MTSWIRPHAFRTLRFAALLALSAGCAAERSPVTPRPIPPVDLVITVSDPLDAPVAGVTVVVDPREDHALVGLTDAQGRFIAEVPSTHRHTVHARLDARAGSASIDLTGADLDQGVPVAIELRRAAVVRGTVRLAARTDHSGIFVIAGDMPLSTLTDAEGRWVLDGWPAELQSNVLSVSAGFAPGVQSLTTGAPGDTTTLPTITLISDPGGTRSRQP